MERTVFRRIVSNTLTDNTDDPEKNHALVFGDSAAPRLALAFMPSRKATHDYLKTRGGSDVED